MLPAVRALAARFKVITFSLTRHVPPFDRQVDQVAEALDTAHTERAVVCGVSYGGLVALRWAATRPGRTSALVLVSTPGPRWRPDERARGYVRNPWRSAPAFAIGARSRLWHEVTAACGEGAGRWKTLRRYAWLVASHPPAPHGMARRVEALAGHDFAEYARAVRLPTLVITGDPELDLVVPVAGTREYLALIPGSQGRTLERTGHIGVVTKSEEFANLVSGFVTGIEHSA